ncbi:hypothetical protein [Methylobacterium sp. P5_C11]
MLKEAPTVSGLRKAAEVSDQKIDVAFDVGRAGEVRALLGSQPALPAGDTGTSRRA